MKSTISLTFGACLLGMTLARSISHNHAMKRSSFDSLNALSLPDKSIGNRNILGRESENIGDDLRQVMPLLKAASNSGDKISLITVTSDSERDKLLSGIEKTVQQNNLSSLIESITRIIGSDKNSVVKPNSSVKLITEPNPSGQQGSTTGPENLVSKKNEASKLKNSTGDEESYKLRSTKLEVPSLKEKQTTGTPGSTCPCSCLCGSGPIPKTSVENDNSSVVKPSGEIVTGKGTVSKDGECVDCSCSCSLSSFSSLAEMNSINNVANSPSTVPTTTLLSSGQNNNVGQSSALTMLDSTADSQPISNENPPVAVEPSSSQVFPAEPNQSQDQNPSSAPSSSTSQSPPAAVNQPSSQNPASSGSSASLVEPAIISQLSPGQNPAAATSSNQNTAPQAPPASLVEPAIISQSPPSRNPSSAANPSPGQNPPETANPVSPQTPPSQASPNQELPASQGGSSAPSAGSSTQPKANQQSSTFTSSLSNPNSPEAPQGNSNSSEKSNGGSISSEASQISEGISPNGAKSSIDPIDVQNYPLSSSLDLGPLQAISNPENRR